jgi:hypothetical protein
MTGKSTSRGQVLQFTKVMLVCASCGSSRSEVQSEQTSFCSDAGNSGSCKAHTAEQLSIDQITCSSG